MKILVINCDCITVNSSANLCHLAYIRGLVDSGYAVTLLSADGKDYVTDKAMDIPDSVNQVTYYAVSLYEKLSLRKKAISVVSAPVSTTPLSPEINKDSLVQRIKRMVLSIYGPHTICATFVRKAINFRSKEEYDYVLSISTPPASHRLAYELIKRKHIKCRHWIQIWEDPWYSDAYGFSGKKSIYREEHFLLNCAEKICYVSPLTLKNQQRLFPDSADKMYWQPLPFYYQTEQMLNDKVTNNSYGYFGDYNPLVRNLEPFYEAAKLTNITVSICGNPCNRFAPTERIHIHPRLPLDKLRPIEDSTNVLVFLCNRQGGQIPGKIYQYSATNKTILFIMDGTEDEQKVLWDFFGKFNRYVCCQNTVEDITRAIRQIESGTLKEISNKPLEEFDPKRTIENILRGCDES